MINFMYVHTWAVQFKSKLKYPRIFSYD